MTIQLIKIFVPGKAVRNLLPAFYFLLSFMGRGGGIDGRGGVNKHILDYYLQNVYYLQNSKDIFPLSRKSTRRPGVATSRWQPLSKSLIWSATLAPPYTTQGLTYTNNFLLKNN